MTAIGRAVVGLIDRISLSSPGEVANSGGRLDRGLPSNPLSEAETAGDSVARMQFEGAERAAERLAAGVRVMTVIAMAALFVLVETKHIEGIPHHHLQIELGALALYAAVSLVSVGLALGNVFRPAATASLVTFDATVVAIYLAVLVRALELPAVMIYSLPVSGLSFLVAAQAAMRLRPWLVAYSGGLFIVTSVAASMYLGENLNGPSAGTRALAQFDDQGMAIYWGVVPIGVFALTVAVLWLTAVRSRRLLAASIFHARRVERLSRFFSPNLTRRLAATPDAALLRGERRPAAVMFVDIRGFTTLSEHLAPEAVGRVLSDFRSLVWKPIVTRGGTVDKFIGDAVLAVFGVPESTGNDARVAIDCARDVLAAVSAWSAERRSRGEPPIRVGIGAHYGDVFAGAVGDNQLMEYTVIGDTVNVAERMEQIAKEVGASLVVSARLLEEAGGPMATSKWRRMDERSIDGRSGRMSVFAYE